LKNIKKKNCHKDDWKGLDLSISDEEQTWLKKSFVGMTYHYCNIDVLKQISFVEGLNFIRVRYMGDNLLLLTGKQDINVGKIIEETQELFSTMFQSIFPWIKDNINKLI